MSLSHHKSVSLPPEFSGAAQLILYTRYGDPRDPAFENKWMTSWEVQKTHPWFPKRRLYVHKQFWPLLDAAFSALSAHNLQGEIKTFDGGFNIRNVRGSRGVLSVHSWGAAIDLNAKQNPLASEGTWSPAFLEVIKDAGLYSGQLWHGRKDPMHFAMVDG